jgi:hypothetical protein
VQKPTGSYSILSIITGYYAFSTGSTLCITSGPLKVARLAADVLPVCVDAVVSQFLEF